MALLASSLVSSVVSSGGLFSLSLAMMACWCASHCVSDMRIHAHPVSSVPGMTHGKRFKFALIDLRSFLTSALVGWELTMHWDGLVSKLSWISATVGAMVVCQQEVWMDDACC